MRLLSLLAILSFALAACAPLTPSAPAPAAVEAASPSATPSIQPTATPRPTSLTPSATPEIYHVVAVALRVRDSAQALPEVDAGATATIDLTFEPVILTITRRADGSVDAYSTAPWQNAQIAGLRYCLAAGTGCVPPQEWQAYQPSASAGVKVDWLGPRPFYAWVEFRDPQGKIILSTSPDSALPKTQTTAGLTITGRVNTATPLAKLPPPVLTALAATRAAFPLTGSVSIMDGKCCAGGVAGSKISLKVSFQASTPAGSVTDMKVQTGGACVKNPAQLQGGWEPFVPTRSYPATLALNWVGWWVSVQYRDVAGNLSPVYCDDISLEGSPPNPTP